MPSNASGYSSRQPYTLPETLNILRYIMQSKAYRFLRGVNLWKGMENRKITSRSWQSMKEHFRMYIVPNIDQFDITDDEKNNIIQGYNSTARVQPLPGTYRRETTSTPTTIVMNLGNCTTSPRVKVENVLDPGPGPSHIKIEDNLDNRPGVPGPSGIKKSDNRPGPSSIEEVRKPMSSTTSSSESARICKKKRNGYKLHKVSSSKSSRNKKKESSSSSNFSSSYESDHRPRSSKMRKYKICKGHNKRIKKIRKYSTSSTSSSESVVKYKRKSSKSSKPKRSKKHSGKTKYSPSTSKVTVNRGKHLYKRIRSPKQPAEMSGRRSKRLKSERKYSSSSSSSIEIVAVYNKEKNRVKSSNKIKHTDVAEASTNTEANDNLLLKIDDGLYRFALSTEPPTVYLSKEQLSYLQDFSKKFDGSVTKEVFESKVYKKFSSIEKQMNHSSKKTTSINYRSEQKNNQKLKEINQIISELIDVDLDDFTENQSDEEIVDQLQTENQPLNEVDQLTSEIVNNNALELPSLTLANPNPINQENKSNENIIEQKQQESSQLNKNEENTINDIQLKQEPVEKENEECSKGRDQLQPENQPLKKENQPLNEENQQLNEENQLVNEKIPSILEIANKVAEGFSRTPKIERMSIDSNQINQENKISDENENEENSKSNDQLLSVNQPLNENDRNQHENMTNDGNEQNAKNIVKQESSHLKKNEENCESREQLDQESQQLNEIVRPKDEFLSKNNLDEEERSKSQEN